MQRRTFLAGLPVALRPLAAQRGAKPFAKLEQQLDELRQRHSVPGLSVAVLEKQTVAWSKGFGVQDRERQIAATAATPYRIASLTKTFASTLLMQLFEQGKLDLEEPIRRYLPEGSLNRDDIRIRHVFTHTSDGTPGERYSYNGSRFSALTFVIERLSGRPFRELLASAILDKLDMSRSAPGQDATVGTLPGCAGTTGQTVQAG